MKLINLAFVFFIVMISTGCATSSHVANKEADRRVFPSHYENTKLAARYSVETLNVTITNIDDFGSSYIVWFSKPVTVWSWGEQGQVLVAPHGEDSSIVEVRAAKNSLMQVSGTDQKEFSQAIFEGIESGLRDLAK